MSISNQETVHEGWLTKSPPTKRIWRARWRRRWFALRQSGELPGQYFLEYYTDRNCRKLKGTIDLDQCEQVDAGLRFERRKQKYQYMFDVKTPARTYYLAADNEADMNRWVDCICHVCGLKADEEIVPTTPDYYNCGPGAAVNAPEEIEITEQHRMSPTPSTASGPYIAISECRSGPPLPSPLSPEEMSSFLAGYSNELSPLSPTSIPPSYAETCTQSLNSYDPRFYDSPSKVRPVSNLNLHLNNIPISTNNNNHTAQSINSTLIDGNNKNGKTKTRPPDLVLGAAGCSPRNSPTDSVFTEDEWTHPVLPLGTQGPRPSDSSVENETVPWSVMHRFSKMGIQRNEEVHDNEVFETNIETQTEAPTPPPRPPKPTHLHEPPRHGYRNLDDLEKSSDHVIYSNRENSSLLIGPRTASTIVADDFYDIPRSHQPNDVEQPEDTHGKHCYTNAAPSEICDSRGKTSLVFRYDFNSQSKLEDVDKMSHTDAASPCTPMTPGTPVSTTESVSNSLLSNVAIGGGGDEPASPSSSSDTQICQGKSSPAPRVNRCLKPNRNVSPPPSIDRKLKPPTPLNSRVAVRAGTLPPNSLSFDKTSCSAFLQDIPSFEGVSLRRQRAAPSPTPPKHEGASDEDNTVFTDDQIYFYNVGDKFIPATPPGTNFDTLQYLDLDLNSDTNLSVPRSPGPSTVYKTVDFLKTEAFKMTRETAEASRTEKQQKEMHKE